MKSTLYLIGVILFHCKSASPTQSPTQYPSPMVIENTRKLTQIPTPMVIENTGAFKKYWDTHHNTESLFYDNKTFGIDLYSSPCERVTSQSFRKYINDHVPCTGYWCVDNQFKTDPTRSSKYYQVEHIIDLNGPEFTSKNCKEIAGNVVMAYASWNMGLGSLSSRFGYKASVDEKTIVYGHSIMTRVRNLIVKCNPECLNHDSNNSSSNQVSESNNSLSNSTKDYYNLLIILGILFLVITCSIYFIYKYMKPKISTNHMTQV